MANISVRLPNGELQPMSYPDDWSQDQVKEAIYKHFPDAAPAKSEIPSIRPGQPESQAPENSVPRGTMPEEETNKPQQTGFRGLLSDTLRNLQGAVKGGIGFVRDIPEEVKASNELANKNNPRALAALASSLASGGKSIINAPHDLSKFIYSHLAPDLKIPGTDRSIADIIPHIPEDTGVEKLLGLDKQQKGERFIRSIPDLFTAAAIPVSAATKLTNIFREGKALKALDKTLEKATEDYGLSQEQTKALGKSLRKDFSKTFKSKLGQAEPTTQYENAQVKTGKVEELEPLANRPIEAIEEPPEPINEREFKKQSNEDFEQAKETLKTSLQHGKEHARHGGTIVGEEVEKVHKEGNRKYADIRKDYKEGSVKVNNQEEVRKIKNTVSALQAEDKELPGYAHDTPELQALNHHLNALESEVIPASDVLDTYQSLDQLASKAQDSAYSRKGLTTDQRKRAAEIADEYRAKADRLAQILEESGGEDVKRKFKEANQYWRKYAELRDINPITKNVIAHGKLPPGTLTKLTGTTKGNDFLNALVGSNADLRRWIIGQEFDKSGSFNRLIEEHGHENIKPYLINELGDIQTHLNLYRDALAGKKEVGAIVSEHKELVKALGEKAAERAETMVAKEQQAKLNAEIAAHEKAEKALDHQIAIEKRKGNSVKALEKEKKVRTEARNETKRKLAKVVKLGLGYAGIKYTHIGGH